MKLIKEYNCHLSSFFQALEKEILIVKLQIGHFY